MDGRHISATISSSDTGSRGRAEIGNLQVKGKGKATGGLDEERER